MTGYCICHSVPLLVCLPVIRPCDTVENWLIEQWPKKKQKMKMLQVKFTLDLSGVREETAAWNVEAAAIQERFQGLHVVSKLFLKLKFDSSRISKHSHCYPFCQQKGMLLSWFISHQRAHDPTYQCGWRPGNRLSVWKSPLEYSPLPYFCTQCSYNDDYKAVKSIPCYSNHEKAFLLTLFWKIYEPIFP